MLELAEGGSLLDKLNQQKILSETEIFKIVQNLLSALEAIQKKNILHGDIKPENILFDA